MDSYEFPDITINGNKIEDDQINAIPLSPRSINRSAFVDHLRSNPIINPIEKIGSLFESIKNIEQRETRRSNVNIFKEIEELEDIKEEPIKEPEIKLDPEWSIEERNRVLLNNFSQEELYNMLSDKLFERNIKSNILVSIRNDKNRQYGRISMKEDENVVTKYVFVRKVKLTEEQKIDNTDKILEQLKLYKKKYPSIEIPKYDKDTEYDRLLLILECVKRQTDRRKKLSKYKLILGAIFMGIELFFLFIIKVNPGNFVESQLKNMDQYELILNEIGDEEIEEIIENASPFWKIMKTMGLNMLIFVLSLGVSKMFGRDTSEITRIVSGFINGKSMQDISVDEGEEESLINNIYNVVKELMFMFMSGKMPK